ncbi:MAG: ABC transporter substrate-binding protein [Deltaproteobacteria bacterium]|nr:ABC transporter substrate-binding protein [Deltaproteobacteria bacterium]
MKKEKWRGERHRRHIQVSFLLFPFSLVLFPLMKCLSRVTLLLLLILFGGCTDVTGPEQPASDRLVVGMEQEPATLDPRFAVDVASSRAIQLLFNGLVKKDPSSNLVPDLAESWETPDPKTYRFRLRKGVKFHDGKELTAADVKYTFDSIRDPVIRSPLAGSYKIIKAIETPGPYTVSFHLRKQFAPFLINMTVGIVPMHAAKAAGKGFSAHPVGTGPFSLKKWTRDEELQLQAFDGYFDGRPHMDEVIFRIIPDDTVRYLELKKGSLDFVQNNLPPDVVAGIEREESLKVLKSPGTNYEYIGFNLQDDYCRLREVRLAVAHSLNIPLMIRHLLKGLGTEATGILYPGHWGYNPDVPRYEYNPDLARKLLDRAGFPPDENGYRFTLEYKTTQADLSRRKGEVIQEQLASVGIRVKLSSYEWSAFFADIRRGNFQLYSLQWVGVTEPDIYYYLFHSRSIPPEGANRGHYINPALDELIEAGRFTLDLEERKAIYGNIQRIVAHDLPYISLWYNVNVVVMKKNLEGYVMYPAGDFSALKDVRWKKS